MRRTSILRHAAHAAFIILIASFSCGAAFAQLAGWWRGIMEEQIPGQPPVRYIAEMTLYGNTGKIDYPTYKCGGELTFEKSIGITHIFRERLTYGRETCVDQGEVGVSDVDIGTMHVTWKNEDVTAEGYLFGPLELAEYEDVIAGKGDDPNALIGRYKVSDIKRLLDYPSNIRDGQTPTLVAFTHARSVLELSNKDLLVIVDESVSKTGGIQVTASNYELTESIRFAGGPERIQFISVIVHLSDAALQDATRRHPDWNNVLLYAEIAMETMAPSSAVEGVRWIRANWGAREAKTNFKGIEIMWKMSPPRPEMKKLRPDLKYQAALLFQVK